MMQKNSVIKMTEGLSTWVVPGLQVLLGSVLLALMAQIAIPLPFTPVPITLQTLGVAVLAIILGPRLGALSVLAYLAQATMGLPVLAGGVANPLWMLGPKAGYLIGFALSAYVVGYLLERLRPSSYLRTWLILSLNETTILFCGFLWLGFFTGWQNAFMLGVLPFLPGAALKISVAATAVNPVQSLKS